MTETKETGSCGHVDVKAAETGSSLVVDEGAAQN